MKQWIGLLVFLEVAVVVVRLQAGDFVSSSSNENPINMTSWVRLLFVSAAITLAIDWVDLYVVTV